ncbi:c-type cytochrome [Hydrogenophaga sp.]|uniref:c-type cytochrome n=1 Tax=Hydrogenophaga sp. TaxID=1904254 RepID=UPI003F727C0E|eukprot:Opistho-1_new@78574
MRSILIFCSLFAGVVQHAAANDLAAAVELAKASGCYSCHANADKVVGPAFGAIAEKYAGEKDAAASLAQSIQNGSKGKWGRIPMPPHPSLSAADLKTLSSWVLTVKP